MPLIPEMKKACETNDVALARANITAAAKNDEKQDHTALSDSLDLAIAHKSDEVAELLFYMILARYLDNPIAMLLALTSNGVSPLRANGNVVLSDKIQEEIVQSAIKLKSSNPDVIMNAFEVNDQVMAERLIASGIDPDMRSKHFEGHTPLSLAAKNNAPDTAQAILDALKTKYNKEPSKLRAALTDAPDAKSRPEEIFRAHGQTFLADSIAYELALLDGRPAVPPTSAPIARSNSPTPLKVDSTITLKRLKDKKPGGKTNIQIFAEQGQLGDVFTADVWKGRREEMDQAWELVPAKHRNQVNIELVRAQVGAEEGRARFRRESGDVGHGF